MEESLAYSQLPLARLKVLRVNLTNDGGNNYTHKRILEPTSWRMSETENGIDRET